MEQELNQGEQPLGGTLEATSVEDRETSRTYTEEEWRTFQSKADKQIADERQARSSAEVKARDLEEDYSSLQGQLRELQTEIERKEDELAPGDPEMQSAARARRDVAKMKRDLAEKEKRITREGETLAQSYKQMFASQLAQDYGIDAKSLMDVDSPDAMELKALKLEREKLKGGKEPTKEVPTYDKGISDTGPSGRSFIRAEIAAMSYEDYKKNEAQIDKAYRAGRIK